MSQDLIAPITSEDERSGKYFIFCLDAIDFGVEIEYVKEIITIQPITPIPNSYNYLMGVINIRGNIVPVVDMRLKLGYETIEQTEKSCIIVLSVNNISVGIIVDEVKDVITIMPEALLDPPTKDTSGLGLYTKKITNYNGNVKQLLDVEAVLEIAGDAIV